MNGAGWQDVAVALIVLSAVGYLAWRRLRARKSAAPCGDCPGCAITPDTSSASRSPTGETLVRIGVASDTAARRLP